MPLGGQVGVYPRAAVGTGRRLIQRASVRALSTVTDRELIADIRAAAAAVAEAAETWRRGRGWPRAERERAGYATVTAVGNALAELDVDALLAAVVDAVRPILGVWWPQHPTQAVALADAVERLRVVAIQRPSLVRDARYVTARDDSPQP